MESLLQVRPPPQRRGRQQFKGCQACVEVGHRRIEDELAHAETPVQRIQFAAHVLRITGQHAGARPRCGSRPTPTWRGQLLGAGQVHRLPGTEVQLVTRSAPIWREAASAVGAAKARWQRRLRGDAAVGVERPMLRVTVEARRRRKRQLGRLPCTLRAGTEQARRRLLRNRPRQHIGFGAGQIALKIAQLVVEVGERRAPGRQRGSRRWQAARCLPTPRSTRPGANAASRLKFSATLYGA